MSEGRSAEGRTRGGTNDGANGAPHTRADALRAGSDRLRRGLGSLRAGLPSPYHVFGRDEWAMRREDTPLTLSDADVVRLRALGDPIALPEVEAIYLPLSRLLNLHVTAAQHLFRATRRFLAPLQADDPVKVPFVIGVAGSVAAGKSTTARLLKALLARWPASPKVDLVTTDGFLKPNARLEAEGLMDRKGFPESYDAAALLRFMAKIKAGEGPVHAPLYSHLEYDVLAGESVVIERPDILILEGVNVLQTGAPDADHVPYVSDYFDFAIYIDADETVLRRWYVERFQALRATAFRDPRSFFHRFSAMSEPEATQMADDIWDGINLVNLRQNILPTRHRADLLLLKGEGHQVERVMLRRL